MPLEDDEDYEWEWDEEYDKAFTFIEGLARVKLDGKWGFIDKTGKEVIPIKYDYAFTFIEGLARVKLDGKWSFIDETGKETEK